MKSHVSYGISTGVDPLRSLIPPEDIRQLVNQIHKHCKKIPFAKVDLPSPPTSSKTDRAAYPKAERIFTAHRSVR